MPSNFRANCARFCFWAGVVLLAAAPLAFGQETPQEVAAIDAVTKWKVINTALFVLGLIWFLWKFGPGFFNARSADIQRAIQEATGLKIEAEFRHSEIDRKMASLADEVKKLRAQAAIEREREHERFRKETQAEIEHMRHNVAAETEALRLESMQQLRQQTAGMAIGRAREKLRQRLASGEPEDLVHDFIHLVERGKN